MNDSIPFFFFVLIVLMFACQPDSASTETELPPAELKVDTISERSSEPTSDPTVGDGLVGQKPSPKEDLLVSAVDSSSLLATFQAALRQRYPDADSVRIIVPEYTEDRILFEVCQANTVELPSVLYQLKQIRKTDTSWIGTEEKIGRFRGVGKKNGIQTPGDAYYYVCKMVEAQEEEAIKALIPAQGFYSHREAYIGDVEEADMDEVDTVKAEELSLEKLDFWFDHSIFRYHTEIDSSFGEDGFGKISWYGGGFQEELVFQKIGITPYFVGHHSLDH